MTPQQAKQAADNAISQLRDMSISRGDIIWIDCDGDFWISFRHNSFDSLNCMVLFDTLEWEDDGDFPVSHLNEYNELELFDSIVDFLTRIES